MIMLSEKIKYIASTATVLKLQRVSCYLEGLLEHRLPISAPVSVSVGLTWGPIVVFLASSQVILMGLV